MTQRYTVTLTDANDARVAKAVKARLERKEVNDEIETDRQMCDRWLKSQFTMLVYGHERRQAEGAIVADTGIAEIT